MNVAKFFDFSKLTRRGSGGTSRSQFYYDSAEVSVAAGDEVLHVRFETRDIDSAI